MAIGATLSFTDLIIGSTLVFSVFFLFLHIFNARRHTREIETETFGKHRVGRVLFTLLPVAATLLALTLLVSSFFERDFYWFEIRLLSIGIVAFYGWLRPRSAIVPFLLIVNVASSCIAPIFSLGFSAGETDQLAHVIAINIIMSSGHISSGQEFSLGLDPYYNLFPIVDFLASGLSLVAGFNTFVSIGVIEVALPIAATIAVVYVSHLLTRDYFAAVASVLLFLATDRLAVWTLIPQNLSAIYAIIAFIPLITLIMSPSRLSALLAIMFVNFSNFAHATLGGFFLVTSVLILVAVNLFRKSNLVSRTKLLIPVVVLVVSLSSYWMIWNITASVSGRAAFILNNFLNAFTGKFVLYSSAKQSLIALSTPYSFLSWALPVSLAFSYVAYRLLTNRFRITNKQDLFLVCATIVGLFILLAGLYSSYSSGSSGIERYSDVPAFTVCMIVGGFSGSLLVKRGRREIGVLVIGVLLISLFLGGSQLNWAPDQYQGNYGYTTQQQFYTTFAISNFLPQSIVMFESETLGYINYWNSTKANSILFDVSLSQPINNNRSANPDYLISFAETHHLSQYYALEPSLITNFQMLTKSPHANFVFNDGQQEVLVVSD